MLHVQYIPLVVVGDVAVSTKSDGLPKGEGIEHGEFVVECAALNQFERSFDGRRMRVLREI